MVSGTTNRGSQAARLSLYRQLNDRKQRKGNAPEREKKVLELLRTGAIGREKTLSHVNPELRTQILANPNQYGLPRTFRVLLGGHDTVHVQEKVADKSFYVDEGHIIHFPAFGKQGQGLWIDNTWVPPGQVKLSPDSMNYTFKVDLEAKDGGGALAGHVNFLSNPTPHGLFVHNSESVFVVQLEPYASSYNTSVSANAGAYYSSHEFHWDPDSDAWKNATWENNAGIFAYDVVSDNDPRQPLSYIEVGYSDNKITPFSVPPTYDFGLLMANNSVTYTALLVDQPDFTSLFKVTVLDTTVIPAPPLARQGSAVKTVYAQDTLFHFDVFGLSFTGAYKDIHGTVYAIQGQATMPTLSNQSKFSRIKVRKTPVASHPSLVASAEASIVHDLQDPTNISAVPSGFAATKAPVSIESHRAQFSAVPSAKGAFTTMSSADSSLQIVGLLNLNPMQQDDHNQWFDAVAKTARADFYSGILTFMDTDLRNTFVGLRPPDLDPEVREILFDDQGNAAFYQSLQVPFLCSSLSNSSLDSAGFINGIRANNVLRDLPAGNPVFKRHSTAFYTLRWKQVYVVIDDYLNDQQHTNYTDQITAAGTYLKNNLAAMLRDTPDPTGDHAKNLAIAQQDVDKLQQWAIQNNLYWAFMLYYYATVHYLPLLQAKQTSGALSQMVSMEIKTLSAVMGMLEGNKINPDGQSFQEAFMDLIRAFQLTIILPQFIDAEGNRTDFIEMIHEVLTEFLNTYSDFDVVKQQVVEITALLGEEGAIDKLMDMLAVANRTSAALTGWAGVCTAMEGLIGRDSRLRKLAGSLGSIMRIFSVVSIIWPLSSAGGWNTMGASQRAAIVTTCVGLFVTISIKFAQGVWRLQTFWSDITGVANKLRLFFGNEKLIDKFIAQLADEASQNIQRGIGGWFTRTSKQSMALDSEELQGMSKMFGKNVSEFLENSVGAVLALVNIGLACSDLARTSDPDEKAIDSLNIISASFSLIAIGTGWAASVPNLPALGLAGEVDESAAAAVVAATDSTVLEGLGAVSGPLSIVFALAGLAVMIALETKHQDPPDPLKTFAENQAKGVGLYMSAKTAIDYFGVVPPNGPTGTSLDGLVFNNGSNVLQFKPGQGSSIQCPIGMSSITFLPDTCLNVQTDSNGNTTIWTVITTADQKIEQVCLAVTDHDAVVGIPPPAKSTTDDQGQVHPVPPDIYAAEVQKQQWNCTCTSKGDEVTVNLSKHLLNATFQIQSVSARKFLALDSTGKVVLVDSPQDWICSMQSIGPSPFTYSSNPWTIYTDSRDEMSVVRMDHPGSQPLIWSIKPPLSAGLELRIDPLSNVAIAIIAGATPAQAPAIVYTVTASITINKNLFSQNADITIEVKVPDLSLPSSSMRSNTLAALSTGSRTTTDLVVARPLAPPPLDPLPLQPLFVYMQNAVELENHPVTNMLLNYLLSRIYGWYFRVFSKHYFIDTYVPGFVQTSPDLAGAVSWDYQRSCNALVVKVIYNTFDRAQGYTNLDSVNDELAVLDNFFRSNIVDYWIAYLRHRFSISPSDSLKAEYSRHLLSPYWRSIRAGAGSQGNWANSSLEMYLHFVKYCACGASNVEVEMLYNTLTTTQPILNPALFPDIRPVTWRTWPGWAFSGALDGWMVNLQDIGDTAFSFEYGRSYISMLYLELSGFYKPHSSSCFTSDTLVFMADGSQRRIDQIKRGDVVQSQTSAGPVPRTVAFVSTPVRGDRSLYSVDASEWRTTSTHPFVFFDSNVVFTVTRVSFVDPDSACMTNPAWQAFITDSLRSRHMIQEFPSTPTSLNELVYDLVFSDPKELEPYCYTVTDGKISMLTASEAPSANFFPDATAFVVALVNAVMPVPDILPLGLSAQFINYPDFFEEIGQHAYSAVEAHHGSENAHHSVSQVHLNEVFEVMDSNQLMADSAEEVISSMGLQIISQIDSGWRFADPPTNRTQHVLLVHMLRFLVPFVLSPDGFKVTVAGKTTVMVPPPQPAVFTRLFRLEHLIDASELLDNDIVPIVVAGHDVEMFGNILVTDIPAAVTLWDSTFSTMMATLTLRCVHVGSAALQAFKTWDDTKRVAFGGVAGNMMGGAILNFYKVSSS